MANQYSIKQLEEDLWASADTLRASSKLNSNQYCMPVLGLIFLKYAYGRFKKVEAELLKDRPKRNGVPLPVTERDFQAKSVLYLPREAQYDFLLNLPGNIASPHSTTGVRKPLPPQSSVSLSMILFIRNSMSHTTSARLSHTRRNSTSISMNVIPS